MYKLCKTEQSTLRQRQIEEGLLAAMLSVPYEDISVSDLCDQMGIPRKAFYRYFDSKDGALQALIDHRLMELREQTELTLADGKHGLPFDLPFFYEFWRDQKLLLDALERSGVSGILVTRAIAYCQDTYLVDFGPRQFLQDKGYYHHAIAFIVCGLMTMVLQWHHDGYRSTPGEMADMTRRMLTQPLLGEEK